MVTIQRTKGRSNIQRDTFYQRRNNSTSDVKIQDTSQHVHSAGEQFSMQRDKFQHTK